MTGYADGQRELREKQQAEQVEQAEPVAIPGAIPMAGVAAWSASMPERAGALERARERQQASGAQERSADDKAPSRAAQAEPVKRGNK
jgi:hypothetical protein